MNSDYIVDKGKTWCTTAETEAGWELVDALESGDLSVRSLARCMLVEGGERSFSLLETALATGFVSPEAAAGCMVDLLRRLDKNRMN